MQSKIGLVVEIYMPLLDEGTDAYRPVPAFMVTNSTCIIQGRELFAEHKDDEKWQFEPGTLVYVENVLLRGQGHAEMLPVAVKVVDKEGIE